MQTITRKELVELLLNPQVSGINGASFISVDLNTEPKLAKRNNPHFGRVTKVTKKMNVMVFQNKNVNGYSNMVKRRLLQEGKDPDTFELKPRRWGERISGTPLVEHKGQYYLEIIALNSGKTTYYLDNEEIKKDEIIGLSKSSEGEQGGLEKKVIIRTPKIASITHITINKQSFEVID